MIDPKPFSFTEQTCIVLDGVPRIGYDIKLCPFTGSLSAIMQYRGDPCNYDYLMGVTGAAFRRIYNRDDGGNIDLMYLHPEPMQRAVVALNYDLHEIPFDRERMITAIKENIAMARPVIGFGIIGPPEAGIIAGYDDGGDTLIGWSYFQQQEKDASITFEPSGYSRRRDTFATIQRGKCELGLVVVGDKNQGPGLSKRDILISALKWVIDLERTAHRLALPDHVCGLAASEAWAAGLEIDADFPPADMKVLDWRVMIHGDQCVMLEERKSAVAFLRMMTGEGGAAAQHLTAAADLYQQVTEQMPHIWPWGIDYSTVVPKLANPATRRRIAEHIRIAAQIEAKAVDELEQAVCILSSV